MREYIYLHDVCSEKRADDTPITVRRFEAYNTKCCVCGKYIGPGEGHAWLTVDTENQQNKAL